MVFRNRLKLILTPLAWTVAITLVVFGASPAIGRYVHCSVLEKRYTTSCTDPSTGDLVTYGLFGVSLLVVGGFLFYVTYIAFIVHVVPAWNKAKIRDIEEQIKRNEIKLRKNRERASLSLVKSDKQGALSVKGRKNGQ